MQSIFGAILSIFTIFIGSPASTTGGPPLVQTCLDPITAQGVLPQHGNPAVLSRIAKPDPAAFVIGQGWDLPLCIGQGACQNQLDESDYALVGENVEMNPLLFPNSFLPNQPSPSDRQLIRYLPNTKISNDSTTQAIINNRLFRTFCGDWCVLNLPYRGSFHCDFLFLLQEKAADGTVQINTDGTFVSPHPDDPKLPKNGSEFAVYFRKGAPIPDQISCSPQPIVDAASWHGRLFEQKKVYAQDTQDFFWPSSTTALWSYTRDGTIKNTEVNPAVVPWQDPQTGSNIITAPLGVTGDFEIYKNLAYPTSETILYLVPKGTFTVAMDALKRALPTPFPFPTPTIFQTPPVVEIAFKEFYPVRILNGQRASTLQLGKFELPRDILWVKKWYEESKPAIYLYPQQETRVSVHLHPAGYLTVSDPLYNPITGWQVVAHPNGTIEYNNQTYPYLYYEAALATFPIPQEGFFVEGKRLRSFFANLLPTLGLNATETRDFIEYWMERLSEQQLYYFIHFLDDPTIERIEPLTISPTPDTYIRIRPYFKPLDQPLTLPTQHFLPPPTRQGFTIVEWGGILDK